MYARKCASEPGLTLEEAIEEALCFGWIDSLPRALDATRSLLLFSPREPRSAWSRINKERVARLLAAGLMAPAGLARVEEAKENGAWDKLDAVDALTVPPDLAAALAAHLPAPERFEAFPPSAKRGILEWIQNARRPETRIKRIEDTARLAAEGVRANQWRG